MGMQNKVAEIQGVFNFGPTGQNLFCKRVAGRACCNRCGYMI